MPVPSLWDLAGVEPFAIDLGFSVPQVAGAIASINGIPENPSIEVITGAPSPFA
jgi:hypothetical protein